MEALHDIEARLVMQWAVEKGDLTMEDYRHLGALTLPDDRYSNKRKRSKKG